MPETLTIIVPCYNEEEMLETSAEVFSKIIQTLMINKQISTSSKVLFVDDGSTDDTWNIITRLEQESPVFSGIKFSRNFGHQNALLAGMKTAVAFSDLMVTIDCDLQDDPQKIIEMVALSKQGNDIVYGIRNKRAKDSTFKRMTANAFYALMKKMGTELKPNHADFRLMSKRSVKALLEYHEENLFLRGVVPALGFKSAEVYYEREPRLHGQSKYPLKKMLALAVNGITSMTDFPLKLILAAGILAFSVSSIGLIGMGIAAIFSSVKASSVLILSMWLIGGILLCSMGILGIYLYKALLETKHRPLYFIEIDDYTAFFQKRPTDKFNLLKRA